MAVPLLRRAFTVDEYYRMAQAGILTEDDRVELLEGEIVEMTPIGPRHAVCVNRLNRDLGRSLGDRAIVQVQGPIRLGPYSEPQPDVSLLRPPLERYAQSHPGREDVLLVIEVADTTVEEDRARKIPLYARAGIRETWLVVLPDQVIEVYRTPTPEGYRDIRALGRGQSLAPESFSDLTLTVDQILGA